MATPPFRPDLLESINRASGEMHRVASGMDETVLLTREVIATTRTRMEEADRLLKRR